MGQQEVLYFLKRNNGKWIFARDISKGLDSTYNCVTRNLRSLREGNLIDFRTVGKRNIFEYRYK